MILATLYCLDNDDFTAVLEDGVIPFRAGNNGKVDGDSDVVGFDAVGFQYFGKSCPRGAFKCFVVYEYLHRSNFRILNLE